MRLRVCCGRVRKEIGPNGRELMADDYAQTSPGRANYEERRRFIRLLSSLVPLHSRQFFTAFGPPPGKYVSSALGLHPGAESAQPNPFDVAFPFARFHGFSARLLVESKTEKFTINRTASQG